MEQKASGECSWPEWWRQKAEYLLENSVILPTSEWKERKGSNTADGSFFSPHCIPGNDSSRYRKRICRFCFLWTPVSMASISQVERKRERGGRERLGGGREQKNKKALDGEEGRRERWKEWEANELQRAGGNYRQRGGRVYEVIKK